MANGAEVSFTGNVTKDPELRFSANGKPWITFGIAVNEFSKDKAGEKQEQTTFWDCKMFGDQAENFAASVSKGMRVKIDGRIRSEKWTGNDGVERQSKTIYVDEAYISIRWATAQVSRSAGNGQQAPRVAVTASASNGAADVDFDSGENPFV
jgi:single-strand DNA-binding protein